MYFSIIIEQVTNHLYKMESKLITNKTLLIFNLNHHKTNTEATHITVETTAG